MSSYVLPGVSVHPFSRMGSWILEGGYRDRAHICWQQVLSHRASIEGAKPKALPDMFRRGIPPAYIPNAVVFFSDATIVFAALAVEEFLNFYGVVRLGERTYLKHCERKSPVSKLKILLATCCGAHTNDDSEIVRSAEQIFRHRNRLVHPQVFDTALKHRELPKPESNSDLAGDSIANLERFTTLFSGYDPEAIELGGL